MLPRTRHFSVLPPRAGARLAKKMKLPRAFGVAQEAGSKHKGIVE
jgi:hypothetical protein